MKVLFATSEARPFAASGGLADVAGALPKAICKHGIACRVVMPLYGDIAPKYRENMRYLTNFTVELSWRRQYCGVFETELDGVIYYFLDNEYYFKRDGLYGYYDDAERYAFFSKAVLEMLKHIDFAPDIIHCNDWQTAMIPVYYELFYKFQWGYDLIRTVFTIHNIQYQGKYGFEILEDVLGIPDYAKNVLEYDGCVNMMKGALELCSRITTVSPTYAQEILDPWYSYGMDRLLRHHTGKLRGILNGIDTQLYDPEKDSDIYTNFSVSDLSGKHANKEALLQELGLNSGENLPLIGMVTRLVAHKGLDLVQHVFEDLIRSGFQVVILGSGEYVYEQFFQEMRYRYPDKVSVTLGFIPQLAKKIYAGADMFLMPSMSEPCGLAQMISLRYGTIPIVRETGGLKDSIQDSTLGQGNGFTFVTYNAYVMLDAVQRAKRVYDQPQNWTQLVQYAMHCDFGWDQSAQEYIQIYQDLI